MEPRQLFSEKHARYENFIRAVGYPQGLHAFFVNSDLPRPGMRVLDAGCGTGAVTLALREAMLHRGMASGPMHAFDLTPAMIDRFRQALSIRRIQGVDVIQCNVLSLNKLPPSWHDYDLVVSASMLEYVPRNQLTSALLGLRGVLKDEGALLVFITRRNWLTRPLIGRWWHSNLYSATEVQRAFREAGFATLSFRRFPHRFRYLNVWGHIVEARQQPKNTLST